MAGFCRAKVGDFAFDPDVSVLALESGADGADDVAHLPDTPLRRVKREPKLIAEGH